MTVDEKLAVIAGNLREYRDGRDRTDAFLYGNLYELVSVTAESDGVSSPEEIARLIIPDDDPLVMAHFCRLYQKYHFDGRSPFRSPETAEKENGVAMPEITRLDEVIAILTDNGIFLSSEYGDSFASCVEDVQFGNCRYALLPYSDPEEGRLRSFDKMRERYGLKIHCIVYTTDDDGKKYGYQLCGLGVCDKNIFSPAGMQITAETKYQPIDFVRGISVFGVSVLESNISCSDIGRVSARIDISDADDTDISGLFMYLNAGADVTIDGVYAEINHISKGFQDGLH